MSDKIRYSQDEGWDLRFESLPIRKQIYLQKCWQKMQRDYVAVLERDYVENYPKLPWLMKLRICFGGLRIRIRMWLISLKRPI